MKYFEIKSESKEYALADKVYLTSNAWSKKEIHVDLEQAIGIPIVGNLQCNPNVLRLLNIPEGTREQFKKNRTKEGHYEAFAKSELNHKYMTVVKKHNLVLYDITHFVFEIGMFGFFHALCPIKTKDSLRYFVELKQKLSETDIEKVKTKEYLTEIKESDYLLLRAQMVKEEEDAHVSVSSV